MSSMNGGSNAVLMLERTLEHEVQARVRQATHLAGLQTVTAGVTAQVVVAGLAAGQRHLPSEILAAAEPGLTLIVLCQEALIQPVVMLAGGRLVLMPALCSVEILAERLRTATRPIEPPSRPREHLRARRWSATRIGAGAMVESTAGALIAMVAADPPAALARDAASIAGSFTDAVATARLMPSVLAKGGAWASSVILDANDGPWSLAWHGAAASPLVASPMRLPSCWRPQATGAGGRVIAAHAGDVVMISGPLPDDSHFADSALASAGHHGGAVLADHLVEHADRLAIGLDALVVEILR